MASYTGLAGDQSLGASMQQAGQALGNALWKRREWLNYLAQQKIQNANTAAELALKQGEFGLRKDAQDIALRGAKRQEAFDTSNPSNVLSQFPGMVVPPKVSAPGTQADFGQELSSTPAEPDLIAPSNEENNLQQNPFKDTSQAPAGVPADGTGATANTAVPPPGSSTTSPARGRVGTLLHPLLHPFGDGNRMQGMSKTAGIRKAWLDSQVTSPNAETWHSPADSSIGTVQPNKSQAATTNPDVPSQNDISLRPRLPGSPGQEAATQEPGGERIDPTGPLSDQPKAYQDAIIAHYKEAGHRQGVEIGEDQARMAYRMHQIQSFGPPQPTAGNGLYIKSFKYGPTGIPEYEYATSMFSPGAAKGGSDEGGAPYSIEGIKAINDINAEIAKNPEYVEARRLSALHQSMVGLIGPNGEKTNPKVSDQVIVNSYVHAMAPNARYNPEANKVTGEGAENIPQSLWTRFKKAWTTSGLDPDVRLEMARTVENMAHSAINSATQSIAPQRRMATDLNVNPRYLNNIEEPGKSSKTGNSTTSGSVESSQGPLTKTFNSMAEAQQWMQGNPNVKANLKVITPKGVRTFSNQ
jgi:hypothetical protein